MMQTIVDIYTVVGSGVTDFQAVDIARSLLAGYSGNYFFFQYSDDEYVLALCDNISFVNGKYVLPAADWYAITADYSTSTVAVQESGSASGGYGGYNSGGTYSGSYSGSFSLQAADPPVYHLFYYHDEDGVEVGNPNNYLVYSSMEGMPHLIEGGTYYAYAQTAILCVICLFVLCSRIFKHVS